MVFRFSSNRRQRSTKAQRGTKLLSCGWLNKHFYLLHFLIALALPYRHTSTARIGDHLIGPLLSAPENVGDGLIRKRPETIPVLFSSFLDNITSSILYTNRHLFPPLTNSKHFENRLSLTFFSHLFRFRRALFVASTKRQSGSKNCWSLSYALPTIITPCIGLGIVFCSCWWWSYEHRPSACELLVGTFSPQLFELSELCSPNFFSNFF